MRCDDAMESNHRTTPALTPTCASCTEAALPQFGGYCIRHAGVSIGAQAARAAILGGRG